MQHVDAVDRRDRVGVPDRFRRFEHRDQQGFLVEIAVDLTLGACRVAERRPGARGRTVTVRRAAAPLPHRPPDGPRAALPDPPPPPPPIHRPPPLHPPPPPHPPPPT